MSKSVTARLLLIIISLVGLLYIINKALASSALLRNSPEEYSWLVHGLRNILGYSTLFLPGYLIYKYIRLINYPSRDANDLTARLVRCIFGEEAECPPCSVSSGTTHQASSYQQTCQILYHFLGLQISYLTWGVLQEKVMTQEYTGQSDQTEYFTDSQFLVFVNRVLAFLMSGIYIIFWQKSSRNKCPLYKYAFCSFSNIMSSWCQYEALKYVSFPHQVLAKAAKTIPVMIMGKVVSRAKYEYYEYVTSGLLSVGMLIFMLDVGNDRASSAITTFSGVVLLSLYIIFDSFTSNWQGVLFKSYQVKPITMMCFVNLFSCIFTAVSLLQQSAFTESFNFMMRHPQFMLDCFLLSVCSAAGQLFIFSTIAKFGPLVFAIITTIRQGLSVLLSCIIYNHLVSFIGICGLILVFLSVLLRIYCGERLKNLRREQNVIAAKSQKINV